MPAPAGPRCAACGRPRSMIVGGRRVPLDCGCPRHASEAPEGWTPGRAPVAPADDAHYTTIKTPTVRELLARKPKRRDP